MKNFICYLNGVSSCGKASIAKAMLGKIDQKTIYLSLDNIHENLNSVYNNEDWRLYTQEVYGLHRSANIWYNLGFNVIIDSTLAKKELWDDVLKVLGESFFVGVFAPLDEVIKREKQKGRKDLKVLKEQFNTTHQQLDKYSLMIDSTHNTPEKLADFIIEKLEKEYKIERLSPRTESKSKPLRVKPDLKAVLFNQESKQKVKEKSAAKSTPKPLKLRPNLKDAFKNKR